MPLKDAAFVAFSNRQGRKDLESKKTPRLSSNLNVYPMLEGSRKHTQTRTDTHTRTHAGKQLARAEQIQKCKRKNKNTESPGRICFTAEAHCQDVMQCSLVLCVCV